MKSGLQGLPIALAGALAGGILGYFLFLWIARHGFYALMLPGGLVGVGGAIFAKHRSIPRGVLCGIIALVTGLFCEWRFERFIEDDSFGYWVTHLHKLSPITLLMIAGGAVFGYWFSVGREGTPAPRPDNPPV